MQRSAFRTAVKRKQMLGDGDLLSVALQFQAPLATEVSVNGCFCLFLQQLMSVMPLERE